MRALAAVLALLTAAGAARAAPPGPFKVTDFGPMPKVTGRIYDDLDGDGLVEILLFSGHRLAIHRAAPDGSFSAKPSSTFDLPEDALYFCLGQVDSDARTREIAVVIPAGVVAYRYTDGAIAPEPRTLLAAENLVTGGEPGVLHWRGFVRDLDGDGLADLLLATGLGFAVCYQAREEGEAGEPGPPGRWPERPERLLPYAVSSAITADAPGLQGAFRGELGVPDVLVDDFNGDGKEDVGLDDGRTIRVFAAGEDGRVMQEANPVIDLSPLADADGEMPRFMLRDLTGDGRPEILVSRRTEGVTDLYLGDADLKAPALRIKIPGWSFEPRLVDLDGDGRLDLVIPSTPEFGPTTIMSIAVTGAVSVQNQIFLNTGDPAVPFRKEHDFVREVRVRIVPYVDRAGNVRSTHTILVNYEADFDGNGRMDLLYREGADEIRFFLGEREGLFGTEPARTVKIPDPGDATSIDCLVADLNADQRLDVALFYESHDRTQDRIVLLLATEGE